MTTFYLLTLFTSVIRWTSLAELYALFSFFTTSHKRRLVSSYPQIIEYVVLFRSGYKTLAFDTSFVVICFVQGRP